MDLGYYWNVVCSEWYCFSSVSLIYCWQANILFPFQSIVDDRPECEENGGVAANVS
jgi:hypothetical protein